MNAHDYYRLGLERYAAGDHEGALAAFNKAIELDPAFGEAFYNRAIAYMDTFRISDGNTDLRKAKELGHPKAARAIQKYFGGIWNGDMEREP